MNIGRRGRWLFPVAVGFFDRTHVKAMMTSSIPKFQSTWRFASLDIPRNKVLLESKKSVVFQHLEPILPGHCVVVPKRQAARLCELNDNEVKDLFEAVSLACQRCSDLEQGGGDDKHGDTNGEHGDPACRKEADSQESKGGPIESSSSSSGDSNKKKKKPQLSFNLSIKDGASAGQCVPHLHVHVVPRKPGDLSSSDLVYSLLDEWIPNRALLSPPPKPVLVELMPEDDSQRVGRSKRDMAAEADLYAAVFAREEEEEAATLRIGAPLKTESPTSAAVTESPPPPRRLAALRPSADEDIQFSTRLKLDPSQVSNKGLTLCIICFRNRA
jgi:bis(5'-adenosyl)-triphosphatase